MNPRSVILAILALLPLPALVACQSSSPKLDLPRDQIAEILGLEEVRVIGMGRLLCFEALDGKAYSGGVFSSYPTAIDVLPGKHTLRCFFATTYDGLQGPSGKVDVELDAKAGAVYQGRYGFGSRGEIDLKFTELSREQVESVRAKEKKAAKDASGHD